MSGQAGNGPKGLCHGPGLGEEWGIVRGASHGPRGEGEPALMAVHNPAWGSHRPAVLPQGPWRLGPQGPRSGRAPQGPLPGAAQGRYAGVGMLAAVTVPDLPGVGQRHRWFGVSSLGLVRGAR